MPEDLEKACAMIDSLETGALRSILQALRESFPLSDEICNGVRMPEWYRMVYEELDRRGDVT